MKPKSLVTIALLAFVAVSVIALIVKEFGSTSNASESGANGVASTVEDRVTVYYFHGNARCVTCRTIEASARAAVEAAFASELESGQIEFRVINVETPDTAHFIEDYQLYSPTVVLVRFDNNVQVEWENLSRVWELIHDREAFLSYIQTETRAMMQGGL